MAQVTDPIMLDSTGQAIKNSIDLLSANINRTASNIPYDSNLTIKGKIDEIDLTEGGTITGNLNVLANIVSGRENGTASAVGTSYIIAGNDKPSGTVGNSRGIYRCYSKSNKYVEITAIDITSDRQILLPNKAGTFALIDDIPLIEDITSLITWNSQYNIWAAGIGALEKSGYKFIGAQFIATNTSSPVAPSISYQGTPPTLRVRGWDANYTFIAMGVWKKI